ncbi:bifunctional riboflavin kinase/FAD synthetase [Candidatus Acetothermia bacterium]|nr:bifunctional riboflavin kinase/FAD synthetase [Candidatus Acetothermia bacterium]MBI3643183.1 bifunctional riboflavin kinase/FAD synthetase [Candidatus Acetothermia bacterium]
MSQSGSKKSVVAIGTFDGIHLGHRALLSAACEQAKSRELTSIAYTFLKPPQNYLGTPKKLLMPPQTKLQLLQRLVDRVEIAEFLEIQPLSAEEFVSEILVNRLDISVLIAGEDFRFGRDRQGNISLLRELGNGLDFEVVVVPAVKINHESVSSTAIRSALAGGDVERATRFLGARPRLWGEVVHGEGQATQLGFPTANLALDPDVLIPALGIYAARVRFEERSYPTALYIGSRPTFGGEGVSIEAHILDQDKIDLYGQRLEVELFHRIRGDQRFSSADVLQKQICADIDAVRDYLLSTR